MTIDYDDLRAKALAAKWAWGDYWDTANPAVILALLDEIAALRARAERADEALRVADLALEDWMVTYASDMSDGKRVFAAQSRISYRGTLAYIANARAAIDRARTQGGDDAAD